MASVSTPSHLDTGNSLGTHGFPPRFLKPTVYDTDSPALGEPAHLIRRQRSIGATRIVPMLAAEALLGRRKPL